MTSRRLQNSVLGQQLAEQAAVNSLTKGTYLRHEFMSGLNGIKCTEDLMESSELGGEKRRILRKSHLGRHRIPQIVYDADIQSIEEWYVF